MTVESGCQWLRRTRQGLKKLQATDQEKFYGIRGYTQIERILGDRGGVRSIAGNSGLVRWRRMVWNAAQHETTFSGRHDSRNY